MMKNAEILRNPTPQAFPLRGNGKGASFLFNFHR
jgi:hypothetical protein